MDILEKLDLDDEKSALQTYLAFLKNANMMTVERLDNLVKDNTDPLLLVLGSMAEFTTEKVCTVYVCTVQYMLIKLILNACASVRWHLKQ